MNVNISVTVGNMIWCYDLDNHIKFEKIIDNIVITASNIYLKADSYDDVICTYKELDSNKPDVGNRLYFSSKEKRYWNRSLSFADLIEMESFLITIYCSLNGPSSIAFEIILFMLTTLSL